MRKLAMLCSQRKPAPTVRSSSACHRLRRSFLRALCWTITGPVAASLSAQTGTTVPADTQTHSVRGQVVNALDESPLPRTLVTLNGRSALTDSQGRFEFDNFTGMNTFASFRKPGFSSSAETAGTNGTQRLIDLDAPVLLKLYPDALISGVLTSQNGAPLSHVQVRLLRSQYDGAAPHWVPAGSGQTNSRGEYRISVPAGRFRLVTNFVPRSFEIGESVLPVSFPELSQSSALTLIELRSGEEKHIDLRAKVGPIYTVALYIEPASSQRGNPRVAISTSAGDEFFTSLSSDQHLELPVGSYTLRVQTDSREESMNGSSRVTVTTHDIPAVIVHLAPDAQFAVELAAGTLAQNANSSANSNLPELPNVLMFNLALHNQDSSGATQEQDLRLRQAAGKSNSFRVPPGRYRLAASGGGQWHIQSATVGATDLLLNDLVVGPGSAGGTLRILVSNQTGTVHARTNLPQNASAWMYLLPRGPSLIPIHPISLSSDGTGTSVATASVPPGAYTAVLLETHLQEDPRDPAFLASFISGPTYIEVQPNADTSFSLELAKRKETAR